MEASKKIYTKTRSSRERRVVRRFEKESLFWRERKYTEKEEAVNYYYCDDAIAMLFFYWYIFFFFLNKNKY